jgi:hypothetical protein
MVYAVRMMNTTPKEKTMTFIQSLSDDQLIRNQAATWDDLDAEYDADERVELQQVLTQMNDELQRRGMSR